MLRELTLDPSRDYQPSRSCCALDGWRSLHSVFDSI
jgi:hypothetical protein